MHNHRFTYSIAIQQQCQCQRRTTKPREPSALLVVGKGTGFGIRSRVATRPPSRLSPPPHSLVCYCTDSCLPARVQRLPLILSLSFPRSLPGFMGSGCRQSYSPAPSVCSFNCLKGQRQCHSHSGRKGVALQGGYSNTAQKKTNSNKSIWGLN